MSLIEGNANGFATKGVVPRLLLSMPLNSGMSGGPILNVRDQVVGTNVSARTLSAMSAPASSRLCVSWATATAASPASSEA